MKIALMHFHLKPGGVATVIRQQVQSLENRCEVLVLSGDPYFPPDLSHLAVYVPGIGYDAPSSPLLGPHEMADRVVATIRNRWPGGCDVLHVHNPILAKNRRWLRLLDILKARGIHLFLQVHDFAEDGRPGTYFHRPYPENCHWGAINARDYQVLESAGLNRRGLHLIANAVTPLELPDDPAPLLPRVLYPIRAIRRKNIGEAILLSYFLPHGQHLAITLPPSSPSDQRAYADWKGFCKSRSLSVEFDVGLDAPFPRLVQGARSLVTTSITEGFGFSFVEAWTAGKKIWGRRIDPVCRDFADNGVDLSHLYHGLQIPLDWIGASRFASEFQSAMKEAAKGFGHHLDPEVPDAFLDKLFSEGAVDFGQIHETHQKRVINRVLQTKGAPGRLIDLNPWMECPGFVKNESKIIRDNDKAVREAYGINAYAKTLVGIYDRVRSGPVSHGIDKKKLLQAFLKPETFCLLKWRGYEKSD